MIKTAIWERVQTTWIPAHESARVAELFAIDAARVRSREADHVARRRYCVEHEQPGPWTGLCPRAVMEFYSLGDANEFANRIAAAGHLILRRWEE